MSMTEAYRKAMATSYANQEGGITIPPERLGEIVEVHLGFQPLGVSALGNRVAIADYFAPAVCLAEVNRDAAGLHFKVDWVRGVDHGVESIRLFPGMAVGGANRCQTACLASGGELWICRNGDREFFVLSPPIPPATRWTLTRRVKFPSSDAEFPMVHSAVVEDDRVTTVESEDSGFKNWFHKQYRAHGGELMLERVIANSIAGQCWPWGYGVSRRDDKVWTVTDFRTEKNPGIYADGDLVVPGVYGNGICFLPDGSALVTRYGGSAKGCFNGVPGALIWVPAEKLS